MPAVVRRLVERRLSELVMAGVAHDSHVSHAPAALPRLPSWHADTRRPAHLALARPKLVPERAALRLVIEHGYGHSPRSSPASGGSNRSHTAGGQLDGQAAKSRQVFGAAIFVAWITCQIPICCGLTCLFVPHLVHMSPNRLLSAPVGNPGLASGYRGFESLADLEHDRPQLCGRIEGEHMSQPQRYVLVWPENGKPRTDWIEEYPELEIRTYTKDQLRATDSVYTSANEAKNMLQRASELKPLAIPVEIVKELDWFAGARFTPFQGA